MKKIFCILFISMIDLAFTKKLKSFIPPGTVQINDTLFADNSEVTNFSWQEYEYWTKTIYGSNSKEHLASLPDTTCWREKLSNNEPYVKYYYRHIAYRNFPVVGISHEQANAFCKWRTNRVKTLLTIKKDFNHQNFEFRLPSKTEWEMLAETSTMFLLNNGKDEKGNYQFNFLHPNLNGDFYSPDTGGDVTTPVYSYHKNWFGLYNMLGNVAEMVSEKGISKGGSWRNRIEECRVGKELEYTKANAWVGFRCVCIIKK
ncbi:MAG: formylglycine-generating enzyme family protein [Bacteroidota bacterium]